MLGPVKLIKKRTSGQGTLMFEMMLLSINLLDQQFSFRII